MCGRSRGAYESVLAGGKVRAPSEMMPGNYRAEKESCLTKGFL